jgi:Rieske Fe-S protein
MVYPASGIANSTGSAWGTSYSTTGSSTVVALGTSPSFTTDIRTPKVTTASAVNLVLDTNAGTSTGSITINTGTNGNITLLPNGTGQVLIGSTTAGTLNIQGASTAGTATITTNVTTGAVSLMTGLTTAIMTIGSAAGGRVAIAFNQASTSTTSGALTVAGGVGISGALNATTKSFIIPHPTKPGKLLRHGSLEGPEFGVYVRGQLTDSRIIELPEYWTGLVDADSITVDLTPIGKFQKLYVEKIEGNKIYVDNNSMFGGNVSCFYTVWATRKDVDPLEVEGDE